MEKKGLGKGLGALIPGAGETRNDRPTNDIQIDQIVFNPYQPRKSIDDEKFQDLVRSVRLHGILQPIVVRANSDGTYELVAGERRLRAATAAGLSRIPATIKEYTNEQSLVVALIENLQREDIGPLEAALAYKRLIDEFSLNQDDVAFRIGKSRPSVTNTLRLLNLPEEIQRSLGSGQISEGHARSLLSVNDADRQRSICQRIIGEHLSVRDTERLCREKQTENVSRETLPVTKTVVEELDPNMLDIQDQLRRLFGTRVSIRIGRDRGKIEIEFYNEDDLNRILGLLGTM
ncbi:MAG: ParB/RepB/Spo0J family partition protein [Armatimonadota bacterium]